VLAVPVRGSLAPAVLFIYGKGTLRRNLWAFCFSCELSSEEEGRGV